MQITLISAIVAILGLLVFGLLIRLDEFSFIDISSHVESKKVSNNSLEDDDDIIVSGKPNVIIVMADQLNFRTLGCYRNHLSHDQAFVWGDGVAVETPHIDSLASGGALYTNFMVTNPQCTPSRASFMTGMYPRAVGARNNGAPLDDEATTFAHLLKDEGYYTAYVGKWHLNGKTSPGWATQNTTRRFGFDNVHYQYNAATNVGMKLLLEEGDSIQGKSYDPMEANKYNYITDFLFDRGIQIIHQHTLYSSKNTTNQQPFLLMLSVPDPHTPFEVRAPYDTMFDHVTFEWPETLKLAEQGKGVRFKGKVPKDDGLHRTIHEFNRGISLRRYFGMVKCLDDNVGKLLIYLEETGIQNNTIVIFTSDHGALLGEHGDMTKGEPFKASLSVPFIIRYPGLIRPSKVIHTAHINVDFLPTLLSLIGIDSEASFHGENRSEELLSSSTVSEDEDHMVVSVTGYWASVTSSRFKLVLSSSYDTPYLFDHTKDPDEAENAFSPADPISQRLLDHISQDSVQEKFGGNFLYLSKFYREKNLTIRHQ